MPTLDQFFDEKEQLTPEEVDMLLHMIDSAVRNTEEVEPDVLALLKGIKRKLRSLL
jgi:hypothetical protein